MDYYTCFRCHQPGHISANCPTRTAPSTPQATPAPDGASPGLWCGTCDPDIRLISLTSAQDRMIRCPDCHPQRDHLPSQYARCPQCRGIIYKWETTIPCGSHRLVEDWQRTYRETYG